MPRSLRVALSCITTLIPASLPAQTGLAVRAPGVVSVGFPMIVRNGGMMIEPIAEIQWNRSKSGGASGKTMAGNFGVGVFFRGRGDLRLYGGPRAGYSVSKSEIDNPFGTPADQNLSGPWVGVLAGIEATLTPRLAVGTEARIEHDWLSGDFGGTDVDMDLTALSASLVVRWFPWRPLR